METYGLMKLPNGTLQNVVRRFSDGAFIPFNPANTDYRRFKEQVLAGAELQDADGNVMTQEQANEFIGSLP